MLRQLLQGWGCFCWVICSKLLNHSNLDEIIEEELSEMATFATNYANLTTTKTTGAISSYLTEEEYKI